MRAGEKSFASKFYGLWAFAAFMLLFMSAKYPEMQFTLKLLSMIQI